MQPRRKQTIATSQTISRSHILDL